MWSMTALVLTVFRTRCARITRSRITIAFLLFVLANFIAQTTLHIVFLLADAQSGTLVTSAINTAGVQRGFPVVQGGILKICSGIPSLRGTVCHAPTRTCAEGLTWLENYLRNTKSEEVVFLIFQSWLVVISLVALLDESIPHLIVVLAAQVVNTSWISYRLTSDASAKRTYDKAIVEGTCEHFDILRGSWQHGKYYVALGFSIVALLGMLLFIFELIKLYSKATLSSVGSSPVIDRLLKWRLWMRVFLLFTTFFVMTAAAIWFNERRSNTMAPYSTNILYDVGFYVVAVVLLPWLMLGSHSITTENRLMFLVYAFLSICLLTISGLWFGSALFRYEYEAWNFFTYVTTLADVLLVITCVLSVVCRVHFGNGLAHFLNVERALQASGFAQDTFQHAVNTSHTSSWPNRDSSASVCSNESTSALATRWFTHQANGDPEKDQQRTMEGPGNIIVISRENMQLRSVPTMSDDGSVSDDEADEKKFSESLRF